MTISSFRLMQYYQRIDRELRAEIARRWPDGFRIQKLKRLKLAVKDRLQNYARAIRADKAQ
ncbi:YdcH family protein [Sphingorhabdus sp.]|uniref:YdcH family protein n=1 Tax=Sphingorhabdus sp. TaxID=1902408 RepID=UPI0033410E77